MKYVCSVCGYEYDPAENDNVPFEQLPDDWTCPVCGVSKDQFEQAYALFLPLFPPARPPRGRAGSFMPFAAS